MRVLVTGGSGFIGSHLVEYLLAEQHQVFNVDKLTYAANAQFQLSTNANGQYQHFQADICDAVALRHIVEQAQPDIIFHLAAETHVDRSIDSPASFIHSNMTGTFQLLEATRRYWGQLAETKKADFRLLHISTDEVFGDMAGSEHPAHEQSIYRPSSPYSASKAASDHLVMAWHRTYGLPVMVTHCSNNYGPRQHTEKLIPLVISNALQGKPLPIYGNGEQIRDWLYVDDHVSALLSLMKNGNIGESYNIGGLNQTRNIDVVLQIVRLLDEFVPPFALKISSYADLIRFVEDRPGHDVRYAIDAAKIVRETGWSPQFDLEQGLRKTVQWYLHQWPISAATKVV
jgi:dTDP-glucose 4,6-dehydratase